MNALQPRRPLKPKDQLVHELISGGLTKFRAKRVSELFSQLGRYWIQSGRIPDEDALLLMSGSIEEDLESWVSGDLIAEAVTELRKSSSVPPKVAQIMTECRFLTRAKSNPAIQQQTASAPLDQWQEVATHRLMIMAKESIPLTRRKNRNGCVRDILAPGLPDISSQIVELVAQTPTEPERKAFVVMVMALPQKSGERSYWIECNPYGLTKDDFTQIPAPEGSPEPQTQWW